MAEEMMQYDNGYRAYYHVRVLVPDRAYYQIPEF